MTPVDPIRSYLRQAPLFSAIVRPVEAHLMNTSSRVQEPCLDLGCGDGLFASSAFNRPLAIGVDLDLSSLKRASRRSAYTLCVAATGEKLPFADETFSTVMSNSVVEHIPGLGATLMECHRVLKRSGSLLITTPSDAFGHMLFAPTLLRRLGLPRAASAYIDWFNGHSRHYHTDGIPTWTSRLERAGFEVASARLYLTPEAHRVFDVAHYLSIPGWLLYRITGRWRLTRESWLQQFWTMYISKLHAKALDVAQGPYLFLDARKRS